MSRNGLEPPGYPGNLEDDPDMLDRSSPDYGMRMRSIVSAVVFGVASWAILIAFVRRLLGH
jgi:hypothetical protein